MQKRIEKIMESDGSNALKLLKLQNLALRAFPSSPNQKMAQAACQALRLKMAELKESEYRN